MSKNAGKSEMKESNALMRDNVARLEALGVPTIEAQRIALQSPELVGMLEAEQLGPSAMQTLQEDPRLAASKYSALEGLTGFAENGFDAQSRLEEENALRKGSNLAMATMASGEQRLANEGTLDSGARLSNMQAAAQAAADYQRQAGLQMAANASSARRSAMEQQANLASQMSNQGLDIMTKKLSAEDAIKQFNAQNKQGVNQYNLGNMQNIENQNKNDRKQEEVYNKGLIQQKFQNDVQKAGGVAQANTAMANNLQQQGQAKAQGQADQFNAILGAGAKVGGAYAGKA